MEPSMARRGRSGAARTPLPAVHQPIPVVQEAVESAATAKRMRPERHNNHNNYSIEWNALPSDLLLRILACLKIEDIFESCLLVCKQWKNAIFSSELLPKLQCRQNPWGYLKGFALPRNKKLVLKNGPCRVLNVTFARTELLTCFDQGIVCIKGEHTRVGNPLRGQWKPIPNPSNGFWPNAMRVDTSTSPASFKIVAIMYAGKDHRNPSLLHSEIFDSKIGIWSKGNTLPLDGPFHDKLRGSWGTYLKNKIVSYDFEQDIWSVKSYLSPENAAKEEIVLYKEEPILVSSSWPWVTLWKEDSCCEGIIIKWASMAILDIQDLLAQHKLKVESRAGWQHPEQHSHCSGDVVMVMVDLPSKKTALVSYDMRNNCWEFAGLMEGACACVIQIEFFPSLITVL